VNACEYDEYTSQIRHSVESLILLNSHFSINYAKNAEYSSYTLHKPFILIYEVHEKIRYFHMNSL